MKTRRILSTLASLAVAGGASFFTAAASDAEGLNTSLVEAILSDPGSSDSPWFCVSVDGHTVGLDEYYYCQGNPLPKRLPIPSAPSLPVPPQP